MPKIRTTISFLHQEKFSRTMLRAAPAFASMKASTMDYDPLLSKLIAWGNSREETIARLRRALGEYTVTGIKTSAGLFRRILTEPDFLRGESHTKWLDELLQRSSSAARSFEEDPKTDHAADAAAIAAALWQTNHLEKSSGQPSSSQGSSPPSRWKQEGRRQQLDRLP
jgi:acetyl-CoA carboxylase biotin carboxylase subunit